MLDGAQILITDSTNIQSSRLTVSVEENAPVNSLLSDPRMDEIFKVGREMNQLRSKIGAATDYIRKAQKRGVIGKKRTTAKC